jgi:hypothetical protein
LQALRAQVLGGGLADNARAPEVVAITTRQMVREQARAMRTTCRSGIVEALLRCVASEADSGLHGKTAWVAGGLLRIDVSGFAPFVHTRRFQGLIVIRLSTLVTPGAAHATRSAS